MRLYHVNKVPLVGHEERLAILAEILQNDIRIYDHDLFHRTPLLSFTKLYQAERPLSTVTS